MSESRTDWLSQGRSGPPSAREIWEAEGRPEYHPLPGLLTPETVRQQIDAARQARRAYMDTSFWAERRKVEVAATLGQLAGRKIMFLDHQVTATRHFAGRTENYAQTVAGLVLSIDTVFANKKLSARHTDSYDKKVSLYEMGFLTFLDGMEHARWHLVDHPLPAEDFTNVMSWLNGLSETTSEERVTALMNEFLDAQLQGATVQILDEDGEEFGVSGQERIPLHARVLRYANSFSSRPDEGTGLLFKTDIGERREVPLIVPDPRVFMRQPWLIVEPGRSIEQTQGADSA